MYNYDYDIIRHSLAYIFKLKHSISTEKPFIYEEIGYSSYQYGAHGLMIWCFSDFNREELPPYNDHPYELGFRIIRSDGHLSQLQT